MTRARNLGQLLPISFLKLDENQMKSFTYSKNEHNKRDATMKFDSLVMYQEVEEPLVSRYIQLGQIGLERIIKAAIILFYSSFYGFAGLIFGAIFFNVFPHYWCHRILQFVLWIQWSCSWNHFGT